QIETAILSLGKQEPSVRELINIALSYSWKPKDTRLPSGSGGGPENTEKNQRSATNQPLHCAIHGNCTHSTYQCRVVLRMRKSHPKSADKPPAAASASSTPVSSSAPTGNVTCFRCKQVGHYANVCPQRRDSSSHQTRTIRLTTVVPARKADVL